MQEDYPASNTNQQFLKNAGLQSWRVIILAIVTALAFGGASVYAIVYFRSHAIQQNNADIAATPGGNSTDNIVAADGRLEPLGEVIKLSSPTMLETQKRIAKLLVKEGEQVRPGQVVAILDILDTRQAALEKAQTQVKVAQARLDKVKAGAQVGEISAQQAVIARLKAQLSEESIAQKANIAKLSTQLSNAQIEYSRYEKLYKDGAIAISLLDSKRLTMETIQEQINEAQATFNGTVKTLQEQINEARATLNRIAEIRPVNINEAQADLESAIASVKQAQADLKLAYVRSPIAGRILKIYTHAGENIDTQGIADIGQTDQMYVVAEVYESDITKINNGQKAVITSETFTNKLQGHVDQIGWQIGKKDVLNDDPVVAVDARVVEVKIRLDSASSQQVRSLTNLKVNVAIHI
ncbi:MAG: ABC exporter membrane fusion protein [Nostoc sp. ChiSLP02]|nr:ABC exporter membrane fusion protein [Nostoc sp. DedSLP05]MDZ8103261.1 ABC exporter membrane fusion protein [Nostoc sp. DedSLP01]MDZ8187708.1 ABC exporter membrane fusion protein [Nostoc sp. ChiSLP02]